MMSAEDVSDIYFFYFYLVYNMTFCWLPPLALIITHSYFSDKMCDENSSLINRLDTNKNG